MAENAAWPVPFFFGGRLCLDFVNTVNCRSKPATKDYIPDMAALLGWCSQLTVFDAETLTRLQTMAEKNAPVAKAAHARATRFRETLFAIFQNTIIGEDPPKDALGALGELVSAGRQRQCLKKVAERFVWSWAKSRPLPKRGTATGYTRRHGVRRLPRPPSTKKAAAQRLSSSTATS